MGVTGKLQDVVEGLKRLMLGILQISTIENRESGGWHAFAAPFASRNSSPTTVKACQAWLHAFAVVLDRTHFLHIRRESMAHCTLRYSSRGLEILRSEQFLFCSQNDAVHFANHASIEYRRMLLG